MKKIFTLIAVAAMALGANAQTTVSFAGLQTSDFTYSSSDFEAVAGGEDSDGNAYSGGFDYVKKDKSNWSDLELTGKGIVLQYKNSGSKTGGFYKLYTTHTLCNGKDSRIVVKNLSAGQVVTILAASKGSTASSFEAVEGGTADASNPADAGTKQTDPANFTEFKFNATGGDLTIQEKTGGYNLASITISGGGEVTPSDPTPATTWDFTKMSQAAKDALAANADWAYTESSGRYAYQTELAADTYVDLASIGFLDGAGIEVGRNGGKLNAGNIRVDVDQRIQLNTSNGVFKIKNLAKDDQVSIRYKSASDEERTFTVTNANVSTLVAPASSSEDAQKDATMTVANNGDLVLQQSKAINVIAIVVNTTLPEATGIQAITTTTENVNAPAYNLAGQQVDKSFKGVVIQNGKKLIQK